MKAFKYTLLASVFVLVSCSTGIEDYKHAQPSLDLFKYFEGNTKAWGMVRDFKGKQIRRFEVDILGKVEGNQLTLEEDFIYNDGKKERRVWTITRTAPNTYEGEAADVIGKAKGYTAGNALHWQYTLRVQTQDGEIDLKLDDWMFLQDDKRLFNVATMNKFGIEVGKITLFFEKLDSDEGKGR